MQNCKSSKILPEQTTTSGRIPSGIWKIQFVHDLHLKKASGYFVLVMHTFVEGPSELRYHVKCPIKNHLLHLMGVLSAPAFTFKRLGVYV